MEQTPGTMTVYLDADYVCYATPATGRVPFETAFFIGREELIPYYRAVPDGKEWHSDDGRIFLGPLYAPHTPLGQPSLSLRLAEAEEALAIIEEAING